MAKTGRFQRTLAAARLRGGTQGEIGDALRDDIIADLSAGGEVIPDLAYFAECEAFLRVKGYVFEAGYLRQLYRASAITAREEWLGRVDQLKRQRFPGPN